MFLVHFLLKIYKGILSLIGFVGFGLIGVLYTYLIFPVIKFIYKDQRVYEPKLRLLVHYAFKSLMYFMHYTGAIKFEVIGQEQIDRDKSCLVVANHPCLVDVVSIIGVYKNACCIVKDKLWKNIFCRGVLQGVGYIPNSEDPEELLSRCRSSIDNGDVLIIFPEGTRTVLGEKMTLQRGAARIAYFLKCPIRTLRLEVGQNFLTKTTAWYNIPPGRIPFRLSVFGMISKQQVVEHEKPSIAARRITQEISKHIDFESQLL